MHLLIVEDERALCETIVRSLRRLAYSVDYCYDGEKALELLGRHMGMFRDKVEVSGLEDEKRKLEDILQQIRGDG